MALEVLFRTALFTHAPFMARFRKPGLYASYLSDDDYWKLFYRFGGAAVSPRRIHPLLGWTGDFAPDTLEHDDTSELRGRRPVLLYGDSFASCDTPRADCFDGIINRHPAIARSCRVLNYGVGGYGLDQIFLLMQHSLDRYDNPFVVVSLMTEDVDRSVLSVRIGQKPYFELRDDALVLSGVPVGADPAAFFAAHPPRIRSYLWRLALHLRWVPPPVRDWVTGEDAKTATKIEVGRRLLEAIIDELDRRRLDYVFLVFHQYWAKVMSLEREDWRDAMILGVLTAHGAPFIWSTSVIRADAVRRGHRYVDYFIPGNGHPNVAQNRLLAAEIARRLREPCALRGPPSG